MMRKTEILSDGRRVYHSYSRNDIFHSVGKKEKSLIKRCDIVLMAPGFFGRFKNLMPALAQEEELAISMGKTVMYQSMYNLSDSEKMEAEKMVDSITLEMERIGG